MVCSPVEGPQRVEARVKRWNVARGPGLRVSRLPPGPFVGRRRTASGSRLQRKRRRCRSYGAPTFLARSSPSPYGARPKTHSCVSLPFLGGRGEFSGRLGGALPRCRGGGGCALAVPPPCAAA